MCGGCVQLPHFSDHYVTQGVETCGFHSQTHAAMATDNTRFDALLKARVPASMRMKAEREAEEQGVSLSEITRRALRRELGLGDPAAKTAKQRPTTLT